MSMSKHCFFGFMFIFGLSYGLPNAMDAGCFANEASRLSFQEVKSILTDFKKKNGYAPNDIDYFSIILSEKYSFSSSEQWALYECVLSQQSPHIQKTDLIALMKGKRDSIRSFHTSYDCINVSYFGGTKTSSKVQVEYAINQNKYYLDERPIPLKSYVIHSYDGDNRYAFLNHIDADPVVERHEVHAEVLSIFYRTESPLGAAMLLPHIGTIIINAFNIVDFLEEEEEEVCVFEKTEIIDGVECVVVGSRSASVYLAPNMDYSVVRYIAYHHHWSDSQVLSLSGRSLAVTRNHSNYQNFGNGIWLPMTISNIVYDSQGESIFEESVTVNSIRLNEEIKDDFFVKHIRDDLLVVDIPNNLSYRWSDRPSVGGLLKETAKNKRVWTLQIISVTVGILMILIWIVIKYLAYRKSKNSK